MFRKLSAYLLLLVILSCLMVPVGAQTVPMVVDNAQLLLPEEVRHLEEMSAALTEQHDIHAVILTVDSLNGQSAQDFADNYYDNAGYRNDGVLFLLAIAEREWYISTCGNMIFALTDYGIQKIGENAVSYFAKGLWYEGFYGYLSELPAYLDAYENGTPIDGLADYSGDYYHGTQEEILYYEENASPNFLLSLLCGISAAGITILIMRSLMNSKRAQRCASAYMTDSSWNLSQHRDMFLYSNVSKTRKQDTTSSGSGSSTHRSSGGRSHGGGGGRF